MERLAPADCPDATTPAHVLAEAHDAATLVAALVVRLRADGREALAAAIGAVLSGEAVGILDPTPPNPHEPATEGS